MRNSSFLPRNAYAQHSLCHSKMSIHLSVTHRYSVKTVIHILNSFSLFGSPTILVFLHQTGWRYSDGDPPNRDLQTPYVTVSFRITSSDLAKYSMTGSVVQSICDN